MFASRDLWRLPWLGFFALVGCYYPFDLQQLTDSGPASADAAIDAPCGCWAEAECQAGTTSDYCGVDGLACTTCIEPAGTCEAGRCRSDNWVTDMSSDGILMCIVDRRGAVSCRGALRRAPHEGELDNAAVRVGKYVACALTVGGAIRCATTTDGLFLGDGTTTTVTPGTTLRASVEETDGPRWSALAVFATGGCGVYGLPAGADLRCWGNGTAGAALGLVTPRFSASPLSLQQGVSALGDPMRLAASWTDIAASERAVCAQNGASTYCWGSWVIEGGMSLISEVPRAIDDAPTLGDLSVGCDHACGIGLDGRVYCWGLNVHGSLGRGTADTPVESMRSQRVEVLDARGDEATITSLSSGCNFACATTSRGELYCWGDNAHGQVSMSPAAPADVLSPVRFGSASDWDDVFAGPTFACATKNNGDFLCWGDNRNFLVSPGGPRPAPPTFVPIPL